jgi:sugar O-acyltransferase (sialic acid O-acetyltransferase NeuD family)
MYKDDWILSSYQSNQKTLRNMKIAIIGAGGHAKEVYHSILQQQREDEIAGFYVEPQYLTSDISSFYNIPIKSIEDLDTEKHKIHIAIGDSELRARMYQAFKEFGFKFETIIDPRANMPKNFILGEGSYVAPGSTITSDAKIGNCVIINTGSIISHDCEIHDFCTISPGAILCGDVRIGERSNIGAGCVIREKTWIRDRVILAMGSVVIKNILDPGTYIIQGNSTKRL